MAAARPLIRSTRSASVPRRGLYEWAAARAGDRAPRLPSALPHSAALLRFPPAAPVGAPTFRRSSAPFLLARGPASGQGRRSLLSRQTRTRSNLIFYRRAFDAALAFLLWPFHSPSQTILSYTSLFCFGNRHIDSQL